jgi:hypothetical protein
MHRRMPAAASLAASFAASFAASLLVAAALLATSGCSFMFSRPPRPYTPGAPLPRCENRNIAPALDTTQAIGAGILALATLSHASNGQYASEADTFGLLGALFAAESGVFAWSASYGFKHARACREQRDDIARNGTMWIAPGAAAHGPPGGLSVPAPGADSWPPEVEQHVDVDDERIDIHTTIRKPRQ